jgi:hypothetical protein
LPAPLVVPLISKSKIALGQKKSLLLIGSDKKNQKVRNTFVILQAEYTDSESPEFKISKYWFDDSAQTIVQSCRSRRHSIHSNELLFGMTFVLLATVMYITIMYLGPRSQKPETQSPIFFCNQKILKPLKRKSFDGCQIGNFISDY